MDDFVIPFKGLSIGNHIFKFKIGDAFFKSFEYFENIGGKAVLDIDLLREPNMMILGFSIEGKLKLQCDRCLGFFSQGINGKNQLIVKFGDKFVEESEDVIVIPQTESRIDIRQYVFEYICLSLPFRKVHPADSKGNSGCNPEITNRIGTYSKRDADPRWDVLKDIKL
ncbi:MAG: DUF177 domain-containing protein [Chlorobi bacterium]|nr:DUF177 domain-containing protein [Chlorobiota bacterium]